VVRLLHLSGVVLFSKSRLVRLSRVLRLEFITAALLLLGGDRENLVGLSSSYEVLRQEGAHKLLAGRRLRVLLTDQVLFILVQDVALLLLELGHDVRRMPELRLASLHSLIESDALIARLRIPLFFLQLLELFDSDLRLGGIRCIDYGPWLSGLARSSSDGLVLIDH